ncbi:hypothetical protein LOTGIDRAFT_228195 [Lottia gigantea]|uniref:YTH domain-containing protein n=1 Tax=Lottia gigantea TaxID=225164 RepID=V4AUQ2_LOTGI|nr:hypothetical protein LOTGIDRAFT_228195 [Lottia gigantea]ESO97526.1 hypothetical protein LOTGIDRAFT_228195 [Lottia gigantea]
MANMNMEFEDNLQEKRYFITKCQNSQSLQRCMDSGQWACRDRLAPPHPREFIGQAFNGGKVILIFSVSGCHGFHGYCQITTAPSLDNCKIDEESGQSKDLTNSNWYQFSVSWPDSIVTFKCQKFLSFEETKEFVSCDGTLVNNARNWQEIPGNIGEDMCNLIDEKVVEMKTSLEYKNQKMDNCTSNPFLDSKILTENSVEFYWKSFVKKVEEELGKVHLACPFGSQRYNLSTPESDIDVFIVYQAKTEDILGFNPPKQTIKNHEKELCDYTVLEIFRYTELLLSGDARCVETLFLHESSIIYASPEWREFQCLDKYLRDAQGSNGVKQLVKWKTNHENIENIPTKINKLCYVIVRLLQNASDVVNGKEIKVFRTEESEEKQFLMKIRRNELTYSEIWSEITRLQDEIEKKKNEINDDKISLQTFLESWLLCQRKSNLLDNT